MTTQFTQKFDNYSCVGDSIECQIEGFTFMARIVFDETHSIDDDDWHNPDQSVTGCDEDEQKKLLAAREAWFNDEWFYCGIVLTASKAGVDLDQYAAALWGIECNYPDSDNSYLSDVANELLPEAIERAQTILKQLAA